MFSQGQSRNFRARDLWNGLSRAYGVILRHRSAGRCELIDEFQRQLDLSWGVGGVGLQEILGLLVVGGVGSDAYCGRVLGEGCGIGDQAVGGDADALVVAVEEVEGFGGEVEFVAFAETDFAGEAEVGGGVVGTGKGIAAVAGEAVVKAIVVL